MPTTFGYARAATDHEHLADQVAKLAKSGCSRIFAEMRSGVGRICQQRDALITQLKEGDTIVVCDHDRLSRDLTMLIALNRVIETRGARLVALNEHMRRGPAFTDTLLSRNNIAREFS